MIFQAQYLNQEFSQFNDILHQFLVESHQSDIPVTACLAVAGPVQNNAVLLTNRDGWKIDGYEIAKHFKIHDVVLVNDFVANGYGLLTLDEETECIALSNAPKVPNAPIACIGAGTGLGECYLTSDGHGNYTCYPSEGGHAEFAPRNDVSGLFCVDDINILTARSYTLVGIRIVNFLEEEICSETSSVSGTCDFWHWFGECKQWVANSISVTFLIFFWIRFTSF